MGPTVHTMIVERVLAETVVVMMKASTSTEVMERVKSLEVVVHVTCTVLEVQGNRCNTQSVRSEELAGQGKV